MEKIRGQEVFFNCCYGKRTTNLNEAKACSEKKGFERIQVYFIDTLKFAGSYEYNRRTKTWSLIIA